MSNVKQTVVVLVGIIFLMVGIMVARVMRTPDLSPQQLYQLGAVVKQESKKLADFKLTDHRGEQFDNQRLAGKWSLLFFGYTYCPDVCPTTMALLNRLQQEFEGDPVHDQIQVVLVSVDPERDTPEKLAEYVTHFNQDFIGVTGQLDAVFSFARDLNSMFAKAPLDEEGGYLVDHSMSIMLINPDGEQHGFLRSPHKVESMKQVLPVIMESYSAGQ